MGGQIWCVFENCKKICFHSPSKPVLWGAPWNYLVETIIMSPHTVGIYEEISNKIFQKSYVFSSSQVSPKICQFVSYVLFVIVYCQEDKITE